MTNLDDILCSLLLQNDCVVIPALGGFVANYNSAKIDVKNGLISPPSKSLSFNKNLTKNDGLLISCLADQKKIPFDEAKQVISLEVQLLKSKLNQNERIHFKNVGFLYMNESGKISFEQERFFNLLLASYGLKNVQFISEEQTSVIETPVAVLESTGIESVPVEEDEIIVHPAAQKKSPLVIRIGKYVAVATLVPLLFYSFWIPMKTDFLTSGIIYSDDFNPFKKDESTMYEKDSFDNSISIDKVEHSKELSSIVSSLSSASPIFTYPLDEDLFIPVQMEVETPLNEEAEVSSTILSETNSAIPNNSYHAIVGCFGEEKNARKLVEDLNDKGFKAYQVDLKGGLHRISAGNTQTLAEINLLREQLNALELNSWVLRK